MKKSLYRKVMFVLLFGCFILLIGITVKIGLFSEFTSMIVGRRIVEVINNSYFSGISCSIIAVTVIYFFQVHYSKRMLRKDFRCNEIIEDIYSGIEAYWEIADTIPERIGRGERKDALERLEENGRIYYEFYKEQQVKLSTVVTCLSYQNNDILIESVQSCFFLNLNFKLLNIVNNIKNRLPNVRKGHPKISETCKSYELSHDDEILIRMGSEIPHFLTDLKFMVTYWQELLDYLNYDPTYTKLFVQTYDAKYDILKELKEPEEIRYARLREIHKEVRKAIWKSRIKNFWNN